MVTDFFFIFSGVFGSGFSTRDGPGCDAGAGEDGEKIHGVEDGAVGAVTCSEVGAVEVGVVGAETAGVVDAETACGGVGVARPANTPSICAVERFARNWRKLSGTSPSLSPAPLAALAFTFSSAIFRFSNLSEFISRCRESIFIL